MVIKLLNQLINLNPRGIIDFGFDINQNYTLVILRVRLSAPDSISFASSGAYGLRMYISYNTYVFHEPISSSSRVIYSKIQIHFSTSILISTLIQSKSYTCDFKGDLFKYLNYIFKLNFVLCVLCIQLLRK